MSHPLMAFCEDFYINMRLGSHMALPQGRESVLHLFEQTEKRFPGMTRFRRNDAGELNLEEDRSGNGYRWVNLESKRLTSGHVNPETTAEAMELHRFLLQQAPYQLGISALEIDYLDVLYGFDLSFAGNHDEIIAESLLADSPLAALAEETGSRAVDFQPTITVALSDDCRLQARMDVITRTNSYQVRTGDYGDVCISVYLILRRYWGDRPKQSMEDLLVDMADRAEGLCNSFLLPRVLRPISSAIASRS